MNFELNSDYLVLSRSDSEVLVVDMIDDELESYSFKDHNKIIIEAIGNKLDKSSIISLLKESDYEFEGAEIEEYLDNFIGVLDKLGIVNVH